MSQISAKTVKELRDRTGLGMMECKKALEEAGGDIELAIDNLRKSGQAKAAKKAGNIAADGAIIITQNADKALLLEVNCQTDFVAKDENFTAFANKVAELALANNITDVAAISALPYEDGVSVEEARVALVQKIGETYKFAVLKSLKVLIWLPTVMVCVSVWLCLWMVVRQNLVSLLPCKWLPLIHWRSMKKMYLPIS